jgi:HAUS augmin-like complex subunit 3
MSIVLLLILIFIPRDHLNETQSSLADIKDETVKLTDKTLSSMVQELAELQATKILRGDYDLKIARQDYFTSKQDQVHVHVWEI